MEIDKIAFELKEADRGYTARASYLKEPPHEALVEIFKGGDLVRSFNFPAYKVWNIAAHFSDLVDSEIAQSAVATIIQVQCPKCKGGGTRIIEDARYTSHSTFRVDDEILCHCDNGLVDGCSICLKPVELGCEHIED